MDREQFTFYASFFRAVSRIRNKAARCDAYDAICAYALTGILPDLDKLPDSAAIAFELSKPNLDASRRKSGSKSGGSPKSKGKTSRKQMRRKSKAKRKQWLSESKYKIKKKNKYKIKNKC